MPGSSVVMVTLGVLAAVLGPAVNAQELLQNPGFESKNHWDCWGHTCVVTPDRISGESGLEAKQRSQNYQGPSQYITVTPGRSYSASGNIKLYWDDESGQKVEIMMDFTFPDDTHEYKSAASKANVQISNGWVHLSGQFEAPNREIKTARFYFQGPSSSCTFVVDDASVQETSSSGIDAIRKSDIHVNVTTDTLIDRSKVQIRILQTKKSFPFGTAVNAGPYLNPSLSGYKDFIHEHFNWAVTENALKWDQLEANRGQYNYQPALDTVNGLRQHGIKVRGHALVWSVPTYIQGWVKALSGQELRNVVRDHIHMTMNKTKGLLEHWDVNNENLHGTWYQDQLGDNDYNLELFRIARDFDPDVKLFLNDYNVVAVDEDTERYLNMTKRFKNANVGLYGIGAQCHFGREEEPDPVAIKRRLDRLSQSGVPIWITELDVQAQDENRRADFYEKALTAMYSHPNVEGILFWGFWDQRHWRGENASLVKGDNFQLTAAGRRVLDLYENRWMTDVNKSLADAGDQFTVRGFHGDYEVHVIYDDHERSDLKQNFILTKGADQNVSIHVE